MPDRDNLIRYLRNNLKLCISDRIVVMSDGVIAGELRRDEYSKEEILRLAIEGGVV